ncbi:MAG: glycosyltransferase family 2 protein [Gaiellaceae bacterium]
MTSSPLTYAVVTPARDEAENLRRLAGSLAAQTVAPTAWIVVDTGSDDETPLVASELTGALAWARAMTVPENGGHIRGGPIVRAFQAGVAALDPRPDLIAKVDADISLGEDYFERLLATFHADALLGIASGSCYEREDGEWRPRYGTGVSVWGAARAYRTACLDDVLPLEERMGWDGIDVLRANASGWTTRIIDDLAFRHHRTEGIRDGARRRAWAAQGSAAHYMGYRPSYLLARTLHRAWREPAALAMLPAYVAAGIRREKRCSDTAVRVWLREQQRLRNIPSRAREALGRASS